MPDTLSKLLHEFSAITGRQVELPTDFREALVALCVHLDRRPVRPAPERRRWLIAHINSKFRFNADPIAAVYAFAASRGTTFNYHEKTAIQESFDLRDRAAFRNVLQSTSVPDVLRTELEQMFQPISEGETLAGFQRELDAPSKLRVEKGERPIDREILLSALAAFSFSYADERVVHEHFDRTFDSGSYEKSFWLQLRRMYPALYNRDRALDILRVSQADADRLGGYEALRGSLMRFVRESYAALNNHGHMALWFEPVHLEGRNVTWELVSDLMLFGEKHDEVLLKRTYFRHALVASQTAAYIPGLSIPDARFEVANEGFTYRDTFVCSPTSDAPIGTESLLLLMQKNQRDETLIPCPACRSHDVQGNSYPSLGVRSWECRNLLCPDRSKYNRGKRYSFKALLMQEAIDDPLNAIPTESVRTWARDVQVGRSIKDGLAMLIRHYSLHGDSVHVFGIPDATETYGRSLVGHPGLGASTDGAAFFESAWFHRYIVKSPGSTCDAPGPSSDTIRQFRLLHGDAVRMLSTLPADIFDAAVTSPPYYNAKEYAQWDNIYCYLRDMFEVAKECLRVLKPGAVYLYNIFDYFDNEKNIVFSAMGDKRLILSAYTVDLFRRAGFVLLGNVTWDKGDIEGKRGFNAGNFSPYYQAPFNCWEHVLVFAKPPVGVDALRSVHSLPAVLRAQPVMKIVNGENVHGHTAPFPEDIPKLLTSLIPRGSRVLDPFGGSCTTARALAPHCGEIVCVERSEEYCALARRMFEAAHPAPKLSSGALPNAASRESARQIAMFDK